MAKSTPKKSGLGRGLDALIPGGDFLPSTPSQPAESGLTQVPVDAIQPNPRQPRMEMDAEALSELSDSIRENGILQPLILTTGTQPGQYTLIAGERRLLAARLAGLEQVPAIVREASEQQRLELALIENVQRSDLTPLEAAEAYRQLSDDFGLSHDQIASRVGKSRVAITNTLRLLKLPDSVQSALAKGQITEGHARSLLALNTLQAQSAALDAILKHGLNVRQTEELVRKLNGQKPIPLPRPAPLPEVTALEERLRHSLGTKVSLNQHGKGGTLTIHYYSNEELNSLIEKIIGHE